MQYTGRLHGGVLRGGLVGQEVDGKTLFSASFLPAHQATTPGARMSGSGSPDVVGMGGSGGGLGWGGGSGGRGGASGTPGGSGGGCGGGAAWAR